MIIRSTSGEAVTVTVEQPADEVVVSVSGAEVLRLEKWAAMRLAMGLREASDE